MNKSFALFTSVVWSKMSNLSSHNNSPSLPPPSPRTHKRLIRKQALHAHTTLQTEMFRLADSGTPRLPAPGGRETVLPGDTTTTTTSTFGRIHVPFFCRCRLRAEKKNRSIDLGTQKARLAAALVPHKHRSLVLAPMLKI